jgi:predicted alpha/beta superfamily hydrolase
MRSGNREWTDHVPRPGAQREPASRLRVLRDVVARPLGGQRDITVCLPPTYDTARLRYPVLYMHDGQNLFDRGTSYADEWQVDEVMAALGREGVEAIVVGIPNAGERRIDEYSPFRDRRMGGGYGEPFVRWITDELKPLIDDAFRTLPGRTTTGMAGSSMGGLLSLWSFFGRGDAFGFVVAMSPALWFARRAFFSWLERQPATPGRIYIDAGTEEGPLVLADVARLRDMLIDRGHRIGRDLRCVLESRGHHDEASWGRRLPGALRFTLEGVHPVEDVTTAPALPRATPRSPQ